jgi:protein phosphatase
MRINLFPPLAIHEIGRRANQEDALWPLPDKATTDDRLFIVCDGMGGHEKGEVASHTVSQSLGSWFQNHASSVEAFTNEQLKEALAYAYEQLDKQDDDSLKKMGTTLTLIYLHRNGITAAHIGDSRIYHIRVSSPNGRGQEGAILYQSRDHSLVFDLYQAGEITYEEMQTSPQKNIITRAMQPGEENRVRPDIIQITDIRPGDYFYLCSDGMLEQMSDAELATLLSSKISDEEKRQQLIRATANNSDNHTAWLIHIKNVINEEGDEHLTNEEPISRCNALNIRPQYSVEDKQIPIAEVAKSAEDEKDDVVVVSRPSYTPKNTRNFIREWGLATLFCLITVFLTLVFFAKRCSYREEQVKDPFSEFGIDSPLNNTLSSPVDNHSTDSAQDTITSDDDTTRNQ